MIAVNKQKTLSYAGRELESGKTIEDYYLSEGCTVHLTLENAFGT